MLSPLTRMIAGVVAAALVIADAPIARADATEQCIASADAAQRERRAGHLTEAEKAAISCAQATCPNVIADDCKTWLAQIEAARPSIAVRATVDGTDVVDVRVSIDGKPVRDSLDGRAIAIDPGEHVLRFDHAGVPSITQRVLVAEGEHARIIDAVFVSPAASEWHVPVATWILGGIGVAAAGTGVGFWVVGRSERATLYDECGVSRACTSSDENPAKTKLLIGDVAVVAGALAVAGAVVLAVASHASFRAHVDARSASLTFSTSF